MEKKGNIWTEAVGPAPFRTMKFARTDHTKRTDTEFTLLSVHCSI